MPIIPKSSGARFLLIILFIIVAVTAFYFKAKDARMPIVIDNLNMPPVVSEGIPEGQMEDGVIVPEDETATTTESTVVKGVYKTYRESDLVKVSEGAKVVLFFNASWCPTCHAADKELLSSTIPDNVVILSVDYDSSTELKKKYLVTYQHTFVEVNAEGNMIKKWSGGGLAEVLSNI